MKIGNQVEVFINREMWNNTYVVYENDKCVVIDLSRNSNEVENFVRLHKLKVLAIILTHAHYDHIGYSFEFIKKHNCKIYVNHKEKQVLLKHHLAEKFDINLYIDESSVIYFDEPLLKVDIFQFDARTFPGHTEGSTILKYKNYVFTGDVVFYDSIGRSDLPTGNNLQMKQSLQLFLKTYHDDDWILPGHSKIGKLKEIKKVNPYLL